MYKTPPPQADFYDYTGIRRSFNVRLHANEIWIGHYPSAVDKFLKSPEANGTLAGLAEKLRYPNGTQKKVIESDSIGSPPAVEPIYDMIPPPQAERPSPILPIEYPLDLYDAPPFLRQWFAFTSNIPTSMKDERRWCVWKRYEDGRKMPYQVLDGQHWSKAELAKCDVPDTWTTFEVALFCFLNANGHLGGLSFALGDGYCGFDFDDVIVDGAMHPQAKSWKAQLGGYSEISQSGNGEKTILRGTLDADFLGGAETGKRFTGIPAEGMATEVYHCRRFFFLTGYGSGEPIENQPEIDKICKELTDRKQAKQPNPKPKPPRPAAESRYNNADKDALNFIDPDDIDYDQWLCVLTAMKDEGFTESDADAWSRQGKKHKDRDVESRWSGLNTSKASWGTVIYLAKQAGYRPPRRKSERQSKSLERLAAHRAKRQQQSEVTV